MLLVRNNIRACEYSSALHWHLRRPTGTFRGTSNRRHHVPRTALAALVSLALFTLLVVPSNAPAQDAAELSALCVEAYGGEEAIAAASAFVQTGEIVSTGRSPEPGRILRAFHRPDKLRVQIQYPDRDVELRVLVGSKGWRGGRPVGGPMHYSMVLQAIRLDYPAFLLAAPEQVSEAEPVERDGQAFRVLVMDVGAGLTLSAEVDPQTGRIHRTIAHIPFDRLPEGLEFINEYSDFREVNGVLFAFKEVTYAQGQHTSDITLEEVKTYDVLPTEHFDPDPSNSKL
jgi:hypothetical protein